MPMDARARVEAALRAVPRRDFLPEHARADADADRALPLWAGQTNSQPSTVAAMLALLDVPEGAAVLDVGAGSGWTTALLAWLTGPTGRVVGVELDADLARWGAANLAGTQQEWAGLEAAEPGVLGRPASAPYDRILVSAMAREVPEELIAQLVDDGVMVVPVAGRMVRVQLVPGGEPRVESSGAYRFVPLR